MLKCSHCGRPLAPDCVVGEIVGEEVRPHVCVPIVDEEADTVCVPIVDEEADTVPIDLRRTDDTRPLPRRERRDG